MAPSAAPLRQPFAEGRTITDRLWGTIGKTPLLTPRHWLVGLFARVSILLLGVCSACCQIRSLINVDFGRVQNPEVGYAAIGTGAQDYWNTIQGPVTDQNLKSANGDNSEVSLSLSNAPSRQANGAFDSMYSTFVGTLTGPPYPLVEFKNIAPGSYDVFVYGHGSKTNQHGVYALNVGGINYGTNTTSAGSNWNSSIWLDGVQFVTFHGVQITNIQQTLQVQVLPGAPSNAIISGIQIIGYSNHAPVIITAPADQSVQSGTTAMFKTVAVGDAPLQYQWFFEGRAIPGATSDRLILTDVVSSSNGLYWVAASNLFGTTNSSKATLRALDITQDSLINIDFGGSSGAKLGPAAVGFNSSDYWNPFVDSTPGPDGLSDLRAADGSATKVGVIIAPQDPGQWSNESSDPMFRTYIYNPNLTVTFTNVPNGTYDLYAYGHYWDTLDPGGQTPVVSYDVLVDGVDQGTISEITNEGWESPIWQEGVQYVCFRNIAVTKSTSELEVRALPASPLPTIGNSSFLAGAQLIRYTNAGPAIVTPSQNYCVPAGNQIGFTPAVVGSPPFHYTWFLNGNLITNATSATLTISNVQPSDSGYYTFAVSNSFGGSSAVVGHLLVDDLPREALLNIDFAALPGTEKGRAAVGLASEDYWNAYSFPFADTATLPNLRLSDGTVSATTLIVSGAPGQGVSSATDPMYSTFVYNRNGPISLTMSNLLAGCYDLYIYGHGPATAFPHLSSANGVYAVSAGSVQYGTNSDVNGAGWDNPTWQEGLQFVAFRSIQITNISQSLELVSFPGDAGYALISGLQLLRITPRSPTNINLAVSKIGTGPLRDLFLNWPRSVPSMTLQVADDVIQSRWENVDPGFVYQTSSNTQARIPVSGVLSNRFYRLLGQ